MAVEEDDIYGSIYIAGNPSNGAQVYQDNNVTLKWDANTMEMENVVWEETFATKADFEKHTAEVNDRLSAIEDQMVIVRRDAILEEEFEELKEAWQAYNDLMDKLRTFKALQDSA